MSQVQVHRLRYRGERSHAGRIEFAVGEALRTETTDAGRLVLVRKLHLGRIGSGERGAVRAAATAWRDLLGSARHGGSSGAEVANCVWFASAAEARVLLLRELARGRTPFAWFWVLAVPDWRRMTLADYLEHRLAAALSAPSDQALCALLDEAAAADATEALAEAILPSKLDGSSLTGVAWAEQSSAEATERRPLPIAAATGAAESADRAAALNVLTTVPSLLYAVLERIADRSGAAALVEAVTRGLVLRLHPALSLVPNRFVAVARVVVELLRSGEGRSARAHAIAPDFALPEPFYGKTRRDARLMELPPGDLGGEPYPVPPLQQPSSQRSLRAIDEAALPLAPVCRELPSGAAGVFLAIMPLIRLGWREWLAEHPDLLVHQPGARLLHLIAEHHRVPSTDAVWSALPGFDRETKPPIPVSDALALWRAALDGWLRRKAQLKLADLVLRHGWLLPGPETTIVRFPLNRVDIRLRRLALDSDPGWVDWLGHAYRLVYRDHPLVGPQLP